MNTDKCLCLSSGNENEKTSGHNACEDDWEEPRKTKRDSGMAVLEDSEGLQDVAVGHQVTCRTRVQSQAVMVCTVGLVQSHF